MRRRVLLAGWLLLVVNLGWALASQHNVWLPIMSRAPSSSQVTGTVIDQEGPVPGATVRVQATSNSALSDQDGHFTLSGLHAGAPLTVTAWSDGYYVGWAQTTAGQGPITITLRPYYTTDNPDYTWFSTESAEGSLSCSHCMPSYDEWQMDAHSQSAVNTRFLTMYNGTDVEGNQSPLTRYLCSRDYGCVPVRPDEDKPYYGPGYKLDFPNTAGNCAACHVPAAAAKRAGAYAADPNEASGIELEGVFCEFCHKIGDVLLDPTDGMPYPNMPGVLSLRLYRPVEGQELFFGQFDDVTRRVSRLPLIEESAFCAPCHFGEFWGVPIYNSYGEWLESPYSDAETGSTCQDCHMPAVDYDFFVYPDQGGLHRDYSPILSHLMPGAMDEQLLQNSVTMTTTAQLQGAEILVEVRITNDQTGHHVPTDSPLRHLILWVDARDAQGQALTLLQGATLPDWCGTGDPANGDYAGLPGKAFAKVLQELWTEVYPSGAYWNQTRILSDNRIAAFATDCSTYVFAAREGETATVEVTLLFRRAFKQVMDWKNWRVPDIVMERTSLQLGPD